MTKPQPLSLRATRYRRPDHSPQDSLVRLYISDRATALPGCMVHRSNLQGISSIEVMYRVTRTRQLTLMHSQIAPIAEDNRIGILPFTIIADSAFRVFHWHVRRWLRYSFNLLCIQPAFKVMQVLSVAHIHVPD